VSSLGATTTVSSTTAYLHLHFSYWSSIIKGCPTDYPLYETPTHLCYDVCPDGTYSNSSTLYTCPPCYFACTTCSSYNVCTNCSATTNRYLNGSACLPNPGFFENNTVVAPPCVAQCISCFSLTNCTACNPGFYVNTSKTSCIDCHTTFSNCNLCTPTNCTQCDSGFNLNGSVCLIQCNDPNCAFCAADPTICTYCSIGWYGTPNSTALCVTKCGDGIKVGTEQCDDGNNVDGDGCNADCTLGNNNTCSASAPFIDPIAG
jgi:cysteine-rich repeat protein